MQVMEMPGLAADNFMGIGWLSPIEFAERAGATVVSVTGFTGRVLRKPADTASHVEANNMALMRACI